MKKLDNKLIIYDSNCRVCVSLRATILAVTALPAQTTMAYKALPGNLKAKVDENRFRNEMALIDIGSAETLYGAEGVMVVFSICWPWFRFLMTLPFLQFLFRHFYKTIAYNRYMIALPRDFINCDCYPETNLFYRSLYILFCVSGAVVVTGLFGVAVGRVVDIDPVTAAWQMLLIAGSGWLVQAVLAFFFAGKTLPDYAGYLATILFTGTLPLLITIVFLPFADNPGIMLPLISVAISFPLMLYMHYKRVRFLGLSQWVTACWVVSLAGTAIFWIKIFAYELP